MTQTSSFFQVGFGERDITTFEEGMQLFGWGIPSNVANEVYEPLAVRSVFVHDEDSRTSLLYACADLCIITHRLREQVVSAVLDQADPDLGIRDDHIMLTATHSHSAPSGYSDYLFYCLSGPGYSEQTTSRLADAIAESLLEAIKSAEPSTIREGAAEIPTDVPIAFNRSMKSWRLNPEANPDANPEEAVRRTMNVLRFDAPDGAPRGMLSFFGTHCTVVHSEYRGLHPDHKGLASQFMNREMADTHDIDGFFSIFAQETAGDVTPNHRYDNKRKKVIGKYDDDFESAAYVAREQVRAAMQAWKSAAEANPVQPGTIFARLDHVDFEDMPVDEDFSTQTSATTKSPVMGIGFIEGTDEGPGPLLPTAGLFRGITKTMHRAQKWLRGDVDPKGHERFPHGNKIPFLQTGRGIRGKAFGAFSLKRPVAPSFIDVTVERYRHFLRADAVDEGPWTPRVTSTHLVVLGSVAILGVSGEPTTVAGQRLRKTVKDKLGDETTVIVNGYANSYNSYIATAEEYERQAYEGASTLYGRHTLAGYRTVARELAHAASNGSPTQARRHTRWEPSTEILARRSYERARKAGVS